MKISPVSFCGLNIKKTAKEIQNNVKPGKGNTNIKKLIAIPAAIIAGGIVAAYSVQALNQSNTNQKALVKIPFDSKQTDITNVAKTYNTTETAIEAYNDINRDTPLSEVTELKIPHAFDYIGDEIAVLQEKLYNPDLSQEERISIEEKINLLYMKKQEQNNVAETYSDGTNLYITINIKKEELSDKLQDKYQFGINIESLKKLFDINDGAIEENNEISSKWVPTSNDGNQGYYDYTLNWFKDGDVIKVPLSSINTRDINLLYYSK